MKLKVVLYKFQESSFALAINEFIVLIFFAKGELPGVADLVKMTVLFSTLLVEDLRTVFFLTNDIS